MDGKESCPDRFSFHSSKRKFSNWNPHKKKWSSIICDPPVYHCFLFCSFPMCSENFLFKEWNEKRSRQSRRELPKHYIFHPLKAAQMQKIKYVAPILIWNIEKYPTLWATLEIFPKINKNSTEMTSFKITKHYICFR